MAGALVGEAFLSATVEVLLDRITSRDFRRFFTNRKLNVELLNKLETTLLALGVLLNDAEEKQITNSMVREWLDKLKDAVFDAEDLLDRINTDALRSKVKAEHQIVTNQVRNFFSSPFNRFYVGMNSKMEELLQRLEHFANQKDILGLHSVSRGVSHRTPTSSLVNESVVVGRDDDKEKLVNFLLSDDANGHKIGVITILGMGGAGKTTLAQLLYNDQRVENHFNLKAWVCVSEVFDATMVTRTLLEAVSSKPFEINNLDFLRVELRNSLRDKKFLFVLDDLWNDRYNDWDDLRTPFNLGKQGSRIIITTRQKDVARLTHTFPIYYLQPLSDEDCWSLLAKHAFENEDPKRHLKLEVIGRKIAVKCDGLPLAAKTLGGLLRSKVDENEWNKVLNSNMWELLDDNVITALHLSYLYLPPHLKRCFAYCSIFSKDYVLNKKQVVLLWMAEGLIQQHQTGKSMAETGYEYFDELLSRSLIQQVESNFTMHDLVNDLATYVSGKSCSRFESGEIPDNVRHLSYRKGTYDSSNKFEACYRMKCLRTFLPLVPRDDPNLVLENHNYLTQKVSNNLLPKQKYLRALSLANYKNINELPNSIGNLIHLRYLDLSFTLIKRLPKTTCKLYNLQTLMLSYCEFLEELPADIGKLVNLHHLDISGTKLKEMPRQISRLQYLQTLTTFIVGKQKYGLRVRELRNFTNLRGKLSIVELQNVADALDAFLANLRSKEQIEELVLEWNSDAQNSQNAKDVLEQLKPSTNLRELTIKFYGGTCFPSWFGDYSFSNMSSLCISDCNHCMMLPQLGSLPFLKRLTLERIQSLKSIGPEFYSSAISSEFKPFPSLETLTFEEMSDWEEWQPFEGGDNEFPFHCLKRLRLQKCPKLRGHLPNHLPSLIELEILECNQLEAKPSSLIWIKSIEKLKIEQGSERLLSLLDSNSQCLLQEVEMERCDSLSSLPQMILSSNCLQNLKLRGISSITKFPIEGLPTSLQFLHIQDCQNLEFLTHEPWQSYTSVKGLEIFNSCHSMTSFPLHCFPNLDFLFISDCTNLKYLSIGEASTPNISSLGMLDIMSCPNLENFPQGGLSTPNLSYFSVSFCENLKSLPERMNTLTSLQALCLHGLPDLVSFPEGGLPANLRTLLVCDCEKLSAMAECGLQRLTSLSSCNISGDTIVKTLLEERLLPTSVLSLSIFGLDKKLLDGNGLQHLTSLQELHIGYCQRLKSLPEDGLPLSLLLLRIKGCPLLEAKYKSRRVKHWSKISHIATIRINDKVII